MSIATTAQQLAITVSIRATSDAIRPIASEIGELPEHQAGPQDLITIFERGLKLRERTSLANLKFEGAENFTYSLKQLLTLEQPLTLQNKSSDTINGVLNSDNIEAWLEEREVTGTSQESSTASKIRIVLCASKSNSLNSIPLSKQDFVLLMTKFKLSNNFLQLLFNGTSNFARHNIQDHDKKLAYMSSNPASLALGHHSKPSPSEPLSPLLVNALLYGADEEERATFTDHITDAREDICHPMLLPLILCEILTDADSNLIKMNAMDLSKVEMRTNFSGVYQLDALNYKNEKSDKSTPEKEFADMTQKLNYIISRFAFHEMRMQTNGLLLQKMKSYMNNIEKDISSQLPAALTSTPPSQQAPETSPTLSRKALSASSARLRTRIEQLESRQRALLLEISCNSKIAQSQLQIVYNLVAQRDNKDNLQMAEISTRIANTTKDDSFAMRTLAIMSVVFLPGTFIASFFSMSMFDWQAPEGQSVVTTRFWIYWAVTGPLTLIVVSIWLFWLRFHKHYEEFPFEQRLAALSSEKTWLQSTTTATASGKGWGAKLKVDEFWHFAKWEGKRGKEEVKVSVESVEEGNEVVEQVREMEASVLSSAEGTGIDFGGLRKRNTVVQGPRR